MSDLLDTIQRVLTEETSHPIYPEQPDLRTLAHKGELQFAAWTTLDRLFRRATDNAVERIAITETDALWNLHFVFDQGSNLLGGNFFRPIDLTTITAVEVFSFRQFLNARGLDGGLMVGFFEPSPFVTTFASLMGIELVGNQKTCTVLDGAIDESTSSTKKSLFASIKIQYDHSQTSKPFLSFALNLLNEIAQFEGKMFKVPLGIREQPGKEVKINFILQTNRELWIGFAASNRNMDQWVHLSDLYEVFASLWLYGKIALDDLGSPQNKRSCLFQLLSVLPSLVSDDRAILRADKCTTIIANENRPMPLIAHLDDEEGTRAILATGFQEKGYQVVGFADKGEFLKILPELYPDLIITDIGSPGMDGLEFLKRIKEDGRFRNIPVIVLSAFCSTGDNSQRAMKEGAYACFQKPTDSLKFFMAVQNALDGKPYREAVDAQIGHDAHYRTVRLLVVDDEDSLRELLRKEFEAKGFLVDEADDGAVAIERMRENNYDLITLGVRMPGVDGLEVLRWMKELEHPPKVIMLTGCDDVSIAYECIKLGASDYLTKPYDAENLQNSVARVLGI